MKKIRSFVYLVLLVLCLASPALSTFPTTLTNAVDGDTEIIAAHLNNVEAKIGVNNSTVTSSLDYMLRHGSSIDPGHKHTPAYGGTGIYTYAVGDLLYASSASAFTRLADVATGNALISGGVTTAPAWGKIGLTTHVSGILGSANGGTGNGFTKFSGPATAEKTFTLPDAAATLLYDGKTSGTFGVASSATGSVAFKNVSNTNTFTLQPGATGADLSWTLPLAAPEGNNYLVNSSTAGVLGYTDPATFALVGQTMNIGTTAVVINRASAALALTGITSIDGSAATCVGNAGSATYASTLTNTNTTTASDMFPLFSTTQGGNYAALTNASLKFNPSTGLLTLPGLQVSNLVSSYGMIRIVNTTVDVNQEASIGFRDYNDADATSWVIGKNNGTAPGGFGFYYGGVKMEIATTGIITTPITYSNVVSGSPVLVSSSGVLGVATSSLKYKTNVTAMEDISWIYKLQLKNFIYKNDKAKTKQYGLIAEEVANINPALVFLDKEGKPDRVRYEQLIPVLVKAMQDQDKWIVDLETKVKVLEAKVK